MEMINGMQRLMLGQSRHAIVVAGFFTDGDIDVLMRVGRAGHLLDTVMRKFMRKPGCTKTPYANVRHKDDEQQKRDVF